MFYDLRKR